MYIFLHIYIAGEQGIEVKWIQFSVEMEIWYYIFFSKQGFSNPDCLGTLFVDLKLV